MRLLQNIAIDILHSYFPTLDLDTLRISIHSGRLYLNDAALHGGQIHPVENLPLRLNSGQIGKLSLHIPWANPYSSPIELSASNITLNFEELTFPHASQLVLNALRDADNARKHRRLAEGERAETSLTRLLQKLLPMFLDRVEAKLENVNIVIKFATGELATFHIQSFSTLPVPGADSDLAKCISASNISLSLVHGPTNLFSLLKVSFDLNVRFTDGVMNADLVLEKDPSVSVDEQLFDFTKRLASRTAQWTLAARYVRPQARPSENPTAWIRYAVRVITSRTPHTQPLTLASARAAMQTFILYQKLHVQRLRNPKRKADDQRLSQLEAALDADMILLLRSQARKHVLADQASAFATQSWLHWALSNASGEREQLAADIRRSLSDIERQDGEEAKLDVKRLRKGWSLLKLSVSLNAVYFSFHPKDMELLSFTVDTVQFKAESDSTLTAYSLTFSLQDARLRNGSERVFGRGSLLQTEDSKSFGPELPNLLEVKVQRPALTNTASISILLAPLSLYLDLKQLPQLLELFQRLSLRDGSATAIPLEGLDRLSNSKLSLQRNTKVGLWQSPPAISAYLTLSGFEVLLGFNGGGESRAVSGHAVFFRVTHLSTKGKWMEKLLNISTSLDMSLEDAVVTMHSKSSDRMENATAVEPLVTSSGRYLSISTSLDFEYTDMLSKLKLDSVEASVCPSSVRQTLGNIRSFVEKVQSQSKELQLNSTPPEANRELEKGPQTFHPLHFEISLCRLVLRSLDTEITQNPLGVTLTVKDCQGTIESERALSVSAMYCCVSESKYNGILQIQASSRLPVGFSVTFQNGSKRNTQSGECYEMDSSIGRATVVLKPESLFELSKLVHTYNSVFEQLVDVGMEQPSGNLNALQSRGTNRRVSGRASFLIHAIKLECASADTRILVCCQNAFVVSDGVMVDGSLDGLEVADLSGMSGKHNIAIRCTGVTDQIHVDQRRFSFTISPKSTNIHLSGLQITVLKSFIDSMTRIMSHLIHAFEAGYSKEKAASPNERGTSTNNAENAQGSVLTLQATALSILLPVSPQDNEALSAELSHITVTFAESSQVFSVRKLTFLTRGSFVRRETAAGEPSSHVNTNTEWNILLRGIDIDFSRHAKSLALPASIGNSLKSEWTIQVLSPVTAFITPGQIRLVKAIVHSLLTESSSPDRPQMSFLEDDEIPGDNLSEETSTSPTNQPFQKVVNFTLDTQMVSLELLNEDDYGRIESAIACIIVGPLNVSSKRVSEMRAGGDRVEVQTWAFQAYSIKVEDRSLKSPTSLQEVMNATGPSEEISSISPITREMQHTRACLHVEGITRTDTENGTTSSIHLKLVDPSLIVCPGLVSSIMGFLDQSSLEREFGNDDCSTASSGTSEHCGPHGERKEHHSYQESTVSSQALQPSRKVTIIITKPFAKILAKEQPFTSSISIRLNSMKVSLLFSSGGSLLSGSQIRLSGVEISMSCPEVSSESNYDELIPQSMQRFSTSSSNSQMNGKTDTQVLQTADQSQHFRHSFPHRSTKRRSHGPNTAVPETVESLCFLKRVTIHLPSLVDDRVSIVAPSIATDSSIESILKFISVAALLDIIPDYDPDAPLLTPPIHFSVGSLIARIRIPTTLKDQFNCSQVTLRTKASISLALARNASRLTVKAKISADIVDEEHGVRDQLLAPCSLEIGVISSVTTVIELSAKRQLRVNISPLTVRTVAGLAFCLQEALQSSKGVTLNEFETEQTGSLQIEGSENGISLSICLRGLVVCCIAEQPRVHLLRVVVRQLNGIAFVPYIDGDRGRLEVTVQDLMLEDTVSWRFQNDTLSDEESIQWSTLFSGTQTPLDQAVISHFPQTPGLGRRAIGMIEGGSVEKGKETSLSSRIHAITTRRLPLVTIVADWRAPLDEIVTHIGVTGLDINMNMVIIPSIVAWAKSIWSEVAAVERGWRRKRRSNVPRETGANDVAESGVQIRVDQVVIEPMVLTINTRAPPRPIEQGRANRTLTWMLGLESAAGLVINIPQVSFGGDFEGANGLVQRVQSTYISALASRSLVRQIVWQAPRLTRLARVFATALLRNSGAIILKAMEPEQETMQTLLSKREKRVGLVDIFETERRIAIFDRTYKDDIETKRELDAADHLDVDSCNVSQLL